MHSFFSKYLLYLPVQYFRKEPVLKHVEELEKTQWFSSDDLSKWQWEKLKKLLHHAYLNVPYYRKQFESVSLTPDDIQVYHDLMKLPILTKEQCKLHTSELIAQDRKKRLDMKRTSGSSGIPLEVFKDRDTFARFRAIMYRCYKWYNIGIGDKQARILGHPTTFLSKLKEDMQDIILNKFRLDPVFLTEKNMLSYYRKLKRIRPKYIYGYPSAIYEFGKFLKEKSLDASKLRIPIIITTGEVLNPFQQKFIESTFKSTVVNEYGCSEVGIIAFPCPYGKMHLSADNLFIEIMKNGIPAEPGETGEVVVTELFNYSAPLIRYNVADRVTLSQNQHCHCGRSLPIINSVEGRSSQLIALSDGRKMHTEIFHYISDAISEKCGGIKHFRVIQKSEITFKVEVVPDEDYTKNTADLLTEQFKQFLDTNIELEIVEVEEISRDKSGKLRYFVSEINQ